MAKGEPRSGARAALDHRHGPRAGRAAPAANQAERLTRSARALPLRVLTPSGAWPGPLLPCFRSRQPSLIHPEPSAADAEELSQAQNLVANSSCLLELHFLGIPLHLPLQVLDHHREI